MIELMSDLRERKIRKQQELEYYAEQLRVLTLRMSVVQSEIELTTHIIDLIDHEVLALPPVRRAAL